MYAIRSYYAVFLLCWPPDDSGGFGQAVLLHLVAQRAARQVEQSGGLGNVTTSDPDGLGDQLALDLLDDLLEQQPLRRDLEFKGGLAASYNFV